MIDINIEMTIQAIGQGKPDDYVISPTNHAEMYSKNAPPLAGILSSSAVKTTSQQFEREDENALLAQKAFKRIFARANATVMVTGILIALVLATGTIAICLPEGLVNGLLIALTLASIFTGGLGSKDLYTVRHGHLLENWMRKRAAAENARLEYFHAIVETSVPPYADFNIPVNLFQLEYFRRFQLDVQLAYYCKRGKDHQKEAATTLSYGGWAVAGAAIATAAAGVLGVSIHPSFAAIGAIGIIFTGLSTYASMREAVNQNRRNAERYERTYQVLENLSKRLDDVRIAVYNHGMQPLTDFVDAVHEQLSLEHRQWLDEQGEARGAFSRLEKTLKELSSKT